MVMAVEYKKSGNLAMSRMLKFVDFPQLMA